MKYNYYKLSKNIVYNLTFFGFSQDGFACFSVSCCTKIRSTLITNQDRPTNSIQQNTVQEYKYERKNKVKEGWKQKRVKGGGGKIGPHPSPIKESIYQFIPKSRAYLISRSPPTFPFREKANFLH